MKTLKLIIIAISLSATAFAQNILFNKNLMVKAYVKPVAHYDYPWWSHPSRTAVSLVVPTKQNNFHEFTLSDVRYRKGTNLLLKGIATGYEYGIVLNKKPESKFVTSLSFGATYSRYRLNNKGVETSFGSWYMERSSNTTLMAVITPRITYNNGGKWIFDINTPVSPVGYRVHKVYESNASYPLIAPPVGTSRQFIVSYLENMVEVRVGVGYKFGINKNINKVESK